MTMQQHIAHTHKHKHMNNNKGNQQTHTLDTYNNTHHPDNNNTRYIIYNT